MANGERQTDDTQNDTISTASQPAQHSNIAHM